MVFVVPTKTTGHMNGLLLSLGGFSNCVLHTYSWLLHNGHVLKAFLGLMAKVVFHLPRENQSALLQPSLQAK
jgi:hypothetical protein